MQNDKPKPGVSILIPTWNGADLLRLYLPPLHVAMEDYEGPWECVIADDGSTDDTLRMLATDFPWVRVVPLGKNGGVSRAFNAGLRALTHPLVLSMNNDVKVSRGFLSPLLEVFEKDPLAFGAGSLQRSKKADGQPVLEGFAELEWRDGSMVLTNKTSEFVQGQKQPAGYLSLACALLNREKLILLGGMNEIFSPFYWEDVELCVRARLAGWTLHFCPESVVDHCHSTTTRKKPVLFRLIPVRNFHLAHWLLLDDESLWREHRMRMAYRILHETIRGKPGLLVGLLLAAFKLSPVINARKRYAPLRRLSLKEIWNLPP